MLTFAAALTAPEGIRLSGMQPIDVRHLGRERVICCWRVGDVLIDPGPESSLATVFEALGDAPPRALLLTHVHLDHAGGAGAIVRRWPEVAVYVHERGAPHLVDPSKLIASAERLYGDRMQRLWGEIVPVPEGNVRALEGGEDVEGFRVAYTPGHASHHVSYLHADSGRAFVGDVAGVQLDRRGLVLPPTPPPDVDVEAWNASLSLVAEWHPTSLGITHFGAIDRVYEHLATMRDRLAAWTTLARELDGSAFEAHIRAEIAAGASDAEAVRAYEQACPPEQQWLGLERYWRQRAEGILAP
jgi:glyoxylase-like metal-dependent hydrolase (beta-lactamase superfamily II)